MLRAALLLLLCVSPALAQSVVPVRPIRAQSLITAADLDLIDEAIPGAVSSIEAVTGREAKVTLYTGRPILLSQIGAPALIERNQLVRMTFASGPLSITTEGRALDRAGIGERVRVMNLTSRQIVTGAVTEDGSIEVTR